MSGSSVRRSPQSFMTWRRILVSSGTCSSSSSAANALPTPAKLTASAVTASVKVTAAAPRRRRIGSGFRMVIPLLSPFGRYPLQATTDCAEFPDWHFGEDQGAFAALPPARVSYSSPITPATIATSARLKTYQLKLKLDVET